MQRIVRTIPNKYKIFDEIDELYAYTSEKEPKNTLIPSVFESSFKCLVDTFNTYGGTNYNPSYKERLYDQIEPIDNNKVILCFSGGKDSVASAIKFKQAGYEVYLYHLKHINASLSDEYKYAEQCAELLDVPLFIDDVRLQGHHDWMEHPMKNMIIASGALEYGLREHITTNIAFGNYTNSYLMDNAFDRCAGDCVDMWDAYTEALKKVLPNFRILMNLQHLGETIDLIAPHRDLLDNTVSCLCSHSLRPYRHNWVKEKFGIELPNNRCGSCYKCCVEYVYMADHDLIDFSEDYYKYCLGQLYKVTVAEGEEVYTFLGVWESYFAYPITQSKIFEQLKHTELRGKRIKW